jgi:hypothetical protein
MERDLKCSRGLYGGLWNAAAPIQKNEPLRGRQRRQITGGNLRGSPAEKSSAPFHLGEGHGPVEGAVSELWIGPFSSLGIHPPPKTASQLMRELLRRLPLDGGVFTSATGPGAPIRSISPAAVNLSGGAVRADT